MSSIEVEYKFRISHTQYTVLLDKMRQLCSQYSEIDIHDEYFTFHTPLSSQYLDVRLRQSTIISKHNTPPSTTTYYLTYKNKIQKHNNDNENNSPLLKGEINEEHETKIENYHTMRNLFLLLQGTVAIVKKKRGYTHTIPITNSTAYKMADDVSLFKNIPIIVELLEVTSLGYFLEIEVLLPSNSSTSYIHACQKMLLEFVAHIGITAHTQIEPRLYMDMLRAQQ